MLQAYLRGKGCVQFDPSQISFLEPIQLTNTQGAKVGLEYESNRNWSLAMPKFNTKQIAMKNNRYFLRTKYRAVTEKANEIIPIIAEYVYLNGEKYGITQTKEEICQMLMKESFIARTLHSNVFIDFHTDKPLDVTQVQGPFQVKAYVKPVLYICQNMYVDFEITWAKVRVCSETEVGSTSTN